MTVEAIIAAVIMWVVFIGGLSVCLTKWSKGGSEWED